MKRIKNFHFSTPPFVDEGTSRGTKPNGCEDDANANSTGFFELRFNLFKPLVVGSHTFVQRLDFLDEFSNFNRVDIQRTPLRHSHQVSVPDGAGGTISGKSIGSAASINAIPSALRPLQTRQALSGFEITIELDDFFALAKM
jgi:hypothetical protein